MQKYQQQLRVLETAEKIREEKVDVHALRVGDRSTKNLSHAFRQVTGMSLTAFRQLPEERALHLLETIGSHPVRRDHAADRRR